MIGGKFISNFFCESEKSKSWNSRLQRRELPRYRLCTFCVLLDFARDFFSAAPDWIVQDIFRSMHFACVHEETSIFQNLFCFLQGISRDSLLWFQMRRPRPMFCCLHLTTEKRKYQLLLWAKVFSLWSLFFLQKACFLPLLPRAWNTRFDIVREILCSGGLR